MSVPPSPPDDDSPAERRLREHLAVLAAEEPDAGTALAARVVRTARWQRAIRAPLRVGGLLAAAVVDAFGVVFGTREQGGGR